MDLHEHIKAVADELQSRFKSLESRLQQEVFGMERSLASRLKSGNAHSDQRTADLEKRLANVGAQLEDIRLAPQRAANMQVFINGHYQCPNCWVLGGEHANLAPVPSEGREERFKCEKCKRQFFVAVSKD